MLWFTSCAPALNPLSLEPDGRRADRRSARASPPVTLGSQWYRLADRTALRRSVHQIESLIRLAG
jgi:hypothetical protein